MEWSHVPADKIAAGDPRPVAAIHVEEDKFALIAANSFSRRVMRF